MNKRWISVLMTMCLLVCEAAVPGSETKAKASAAEDIVYDVNNLTQEQQNMLAPMDAVGAVLDVYNPDYSVSYDVNNPDCVWQALYYMIVDYFQTLFSDSSGLTVETGSLLASEELLKECVYAMFSDFDGNLPDETDYEKAGESYVFYLSNRGDEFPMISSWIEHPDGTCTAETQLWVDAKSNLAEEFRFELIPNAHVDQYENPLFFYSIDSVEVLYPDVQEESAYILPDSDSRFYTEVELSTLSEEEFTLAKNEIYARHGRIFTTDYIREYFESQPWYQGTIEPDDFSDSVFNEYEQANIDLMAAMEENGWETVTVQATGGTAGTFSFADIDGMEFSFSSGAGAWATGFTVYADGSFVGSYHDSNMGDSDPSYPGGTVEYAEFSGQFSEPEQVNDYSWSFRIESLELDTPEDSYEILDQVRYHYCEPYGLGEGDAWLVYLPGTAVSLLPEDFVDWIYGLWDLETLPYYGMYDTTAESGWRGYDL